MANSTIMKTTVNKNEKIRNNNNPFLNTKKQAPFFSIQPKLKIGSPDDKYEQEADQIADMVVQNTNDDKVFIGNSSFFASQNHSDKTREKPIAETFSPLAQRQKEEEELQMNRIQRQEEEEELQMQPMEDEKLQLQTEEEEIQMSAENVADVGSLIESGINGSSGNGNKMDEATRIQMEAGFGTNFGNVNIHTDSAAIQMSRQLHAHAFTHGNDIFFNKGKYSPETSEGKRLLAHELAHTLQQNNTIQKADYIQRTDNLVQLTPEEDFLHTSDIQLMQCVNSFNALYHQSSDYSLGARQIGDAVRTKFLNEAEKYETAYTLYSNTIAAARREAQNQNQWIGIIVGIGVGIGAGVLTAFLLPATASAAVTLTLGDALVAAGAATGQGIVGAGLTSVVSDAISVPGSDLSPSGLSPSIMRLNVWIKAAQIYREGLAQVETQQRLHRLSLMSAETRRQIQQRLHGEDTRLSIAEIRNVVPILYRTRTNLFSANDMYQQKLNQQSTILQQINQYVGPNSGEMEKGIWILWINDIDVADSDILDLDAIEDHLENIRVIGPGSILGVDFGIWTTRTDEVNAIFASIRHAGRIRRLFNNLQTGSIAVVTSPTPFSSS